MNQYQRLLGLSTTEISDALDACGVEGALFHIKPLIAGTKLIGPAYTIQYSLYEKKPDTFKGAADYIDAVPANSVIVIDNKGRSDCTTWGDILTQVAIHKKIAGTVVNGAVRDVACIRAAKYPVYCAAVYMRSGKNRVYKSGEQCPLLINDVTINPGDLIFGDDDGVLVIPQHLINEVLDKAENIQSTENKIITAVKTGLSLEQARKDFRYDQPWLNNKK
ncbi:MULTISPECIES: RraA family protein [Legionella]|uniref:Putative 4-hydroxy-4-methyl-2-oxoglutarate aldolase n=1 Tax=Legionella maceachernii TaxID=466 RepID=A0A0W0VZU5_9GAMM|nr:RraA family protein [Legionella maceachernii]KTD25562.1 DlpA protein (isocitrate and isopropylmalate dehydrogenase family protein) [Legionella maceachernii]SJZ56207.1 Regulator of RNase E activity RraA [Legionella maceachernii]SUP00501.1 Putative regulator of ribonuclease activity [Legionella maceachernii]